MEENKEELELLESPIESKEPTDIECTKQGENEKEKKIPKLKVKEVEIVKCKKCSNPLLYNKFRNTYICMQCNLSYNFN